MVSAFHLLNCLFTCLGNTHYFGKNTHLFSSIKKHNFSDWRIEAADNRKTLPLEIGNNLVGVSNAGTVSIC